MVWNGHETDTPHNVNFDILHSLVWNGGVWVPSPLDRSLDRDVHFPLIRTAKSPCVPFQHLDLAAAPLTE